MNKKLLFHFSLFVFAVMNFSAADAQYYSLSKLYHPGNPGGLNTDANVDASTGAPPTGSTILITYPTAKGYTLQYSAVQTIPFIFNFNGGAVTQYKVSTSGYVTFSKATTTPVGPANSALPNANLPDSTICVWGFGGAAGGGDIYTKVYGTAPHRQLWIDFWFAGNPVLADSNSQNIWAIVLEETTNNIYVVDQWAFSNTTIYNPISLTVGIQVDSNTAYQIAGSPNVLSQTFSVATPPDANNDYYEFIPGAQPSYEASVVSSNINNALYYGVGVPYPIVGKVANFGADTLKSFNLNWSINSGTANIDSVTGANVASEPVVEYDSVLHTVKWTPAAVGTYTMKLWVDNIDSGHTDTNPALDTLIISNIQVIDTVVPKMVMLEEFMQASCNPCMYAAPNLDSVLTNNMAYCNPVRYHVNWPGTDYMNNETQTPFVSARVSYYGVTGVPDAKIDGTIDVSPATVASSDIRNEAIMGSPVKITVTSCTFNTTMNLYNLQATIKSYGNLPASVANVVLTVDTITYLADQSTEDPLSSFAPPLGTGTNPDSYYPYVMEFPQAAEDMLPSSSGTALTAFTPGQTQTINVNWTKNRPWGSSPKTYKYDSTGVHFTVFVANKSTKYVYQSLSVAPTVFVGINELSNNAGSMQVFPNPFNNETHVVYNLNQSQNVTIEVWDIMGQKVVDMSNGRQTEGQHEAIINKGNLQPGMYFLRLITNEGIAIQKIEVE
ncbi:MAG: T9SS type A sorting domain-containing protein [Bacteroidia bacterium]